MVLFNKREVQDAVDHFSYFLFLKRKSIYQIMKGNNKSVTLTNKKNEIVGECSIVTSEDLGVKIIGCMVSGSKNGETKVFEKTKDFINFMDERGG